MPDSLREAKPQHMDLRGRLQATKKHWHTIWKLQKEGKRREEGSDWNVEERGGVWGDTSDPSWPAGSGST